VPTLEPKKFFRRIIVIQFLTAFSWALISVSFPILLKEHFHSDQVVSALYTFFNIVSLITLFISVPVVRYFHQRRSFDVALLLMPTLLLLMAFVGAPWELVLLFSLFTFCCDIYIFNIDLYLPRLQEKESLAQMAGKLGAIYNVAWVAGPLLGAWLAQKTGQPSVFLAACGASALAFLCLPWHGLPRANLGEGLNNPLNSIRVFVGDRHRVQAFINGLGIDFVYGSWFLLVLFLEEKLRLDIWTIGLITGVIGIPWVLLEVPIGKAADRLISSRTLFTIGYILMAISMVFMGQTTQVWSFFVLYLLAVIGSCGLEQTNIPYFIKSLSKEDLGLLSIFLLKMPLGRLVAPFIATALLTRFDINTVISLFGIITLLFALNALLLPKKTDQ
jgi:MFS family permease